MKIAFISRSTLFTVPGGDTRQAMLTAEYLRKNGIEVEICLSKDRINYSQYDLLHFFNIIRPADIIRHIRTSKKPYVVSPVFVEYGKVNDDARKGIKGLLRKVFSDDFLEYIKTVARAVKNGEKIVSKEYLIWGHVRSVKYVAKNAACLLPNSQSEYNRFYNAYHLACKYHVVPNGIDKKNTLRIYPEDAQYKGSVIFMGRIEHLKNQLGLIRALNNTEYKVFIHGKPSPNSMAYYQQCLAEAGPNITIGDWLEEEELYTAYSNARVHVLPSYFETTGLSSLEAAVMGCNIVVTPRGDTEDYFGEHAWYCDPDDIGSIKRAVDEAYHAPYDEKFRQYILDHYTWERAAEETLKVYREVLNKN